MIIYHFVYLLKKIYKRAHVMKQEENKDDSVLFLRFYFIFNVSFCHERLGDCILCSLRST